MVHIDYSKMVHECSQVGCHALTPLTERYCEQHKQLANHRWMERKAKNKKTQLGQLMQQQRQKAYDLTERDKEATAFYHSTAWKRVRDYVYSRDHATCQVCGNIVTNRKIVDHIVPRRLLTRQQALDTDNLWTLCYQCHFRKTKVEQSIELQTQGDTKLRHLGRSWWYKVLNEKKAAHG